MNVDFATIAVSTEGAVGRLELDRPDKLNALSTVMLLEIRDAARWFDDQREVKVVVVSGRGRSFSAGADLAAFVGEGESVEGESVEGRSAEGRSAEGPAIERRGADRTGRDAADAGRMMADALEAMEAVAIVALHGWCVGGGVVLASACDLRIAADSARFSIPEIDLGLPLAWGGIPRLVRDIGAARTKELVMTGRRFDASEAERIGFVNRVVPADELTSAVDEFAVTLAAKARYALLSIKANANAVTSQMVGAGRAWADADGLELGLHDPEGRAAAQRYLEGLG